MEMRLYSIQGKVIRGSREVVRQPREGRTGVKGGHTIAKGRSYEAQGEGVWLSRESRTEVRMMYMVSMGEKLP